MLVSQLTDTLKVRPEELPDRIAALIDQLRDAEKEIDRFRAGAGAAGGGAGRAGPPRRLRRHVVAPRRRRVRAPTTCARFALDVRGRMPGERPAVVAVGGVVKGRPQLVVATNEEARRWGAARPATSCGRRAAVLGGNGGGKQDVAQGGGTEPRPFGEALQQIEHTVGERVTAGR